MKKSLLLMFWILTLFVGLSGGKKESTSNSKTLQGLWELRKVSGGWTNVNYQSGKGYTIRFTGNDYEITERMGS
jgi:hypothetical protein